jgi:hypothetical protein
MIIISECFIPKLIPKIKYPKPEKELSFGEAKANGTMSL